MPLPPASSGLARTLRRSLSAALSLLALTLAGQEQTLTTAAEIRSISLAQAEQALPASIRGVVVYLEPGSVFVQDHTSTTFFLPGTRLRELSVGDLVEVQGVTRMGLFMPGLDVSPFRVVGREAVPPGISVGYDDLISGRFHYQRVAIEGVVRSIEKLNETRSLLRLAMGSRVLEARVDSPLTAASDLVDARVRVTGLAAGSINEQRQLVLPYVCVTDWSDIAVLEAATPLEQVPSISSEELLAFRDSGIHQRRIRIAGLVSAAFPPDTAFLQQGSRAFGVRFRSAIDLKPGDEVELAGFAAMDRYTASVVDAELLKRSDGPAPAPRIVSDLEKLSGIHDGELVTVRAIVRETSRTGRVVLSLKSGGRSLQVQLAPGTPTPEPLSEIQVTAVCLVETARSDVGPFRSSADAITLRTREAGDLVVLRKAPWWTPQRLTLSLVVLCGVIVVTGLWIALLRRQVRQKTEVLRRRIETEVALRERQRIARDFHDSLNQDLTGLGLRLDAAATRQVDEKGRLILEASRSLLSRIQTETRNFVLDLREDVAHDADLVKALEGIAAAPKPDGIELRIEFSGPLPPLPVPIVHHLRMMVRESVANALKHASPTLVNIVVAGEDGIRIRVTDDGCGFDVATETHGKTGHFGCIGLRERADKIGATVAWYSAPGEGCTVEIALPKSAVGAESDPQVTQPAAQTPSYPHSS